MKKNDLLPKFQILFITFLLISLSMTAQVGIGTTTPAGGSLLDLTSTNKGFLVPRVNIANLATIAPVTGGTTIGLLVWNTRVGTGVGYHYWSGTRWIPLGAGGVDWALTGNTITGTEVLGTLSNHDLNIVTNGAANTRMRVQANGQVSVNFAGAANAGDQFSAVGTSAVNGYTGNGVGVYGQATTGFAALAIATGANGVGVQGQSTLWRGVVGSGATFGTIGFTTAGIGAQGQSTTGDGVRGFSTSGDGVYGQSTSGVGVWGNSINFDGVWGTADAGDGVYGDSASGNGVIGLSTSFIGVRGGAFNNSGYGAFFTNTGALGHGLIVAGNNLGGVIIPASGAGTVSQGETYGILGFANNTAGTGVVGVGNSSLTFTTYPNGSGVAGSGSEVGVYGYASGTTGVEEGVTGQGFTGVAAYGDLVTVGGLGLYAQGDTGAYGIGIDGVVGESTSPVLGWGVLSLGDFGATGGKFFNIDHPLDPANKILKHASIESNEILNLYRGKEVFDSNGRATISLPHYFDAVNNDNINYQLTPIGAAMPNLYIEKEVTNGTFIIAGGEPGKKVSWQVTAERNGPYLQQYPEKRNMEVDKGENRGKYLMPELFGQPKESGIYYRAPQKGLNDSNNRKTETLEHVKENNNSSTIRKETKKDVEIEEAIQPQESKSVSLEVTSKNTDATTKVVKTLVNSDEQE